MYFLQKIFQFRDHSNPDAEKPFLEHLEDLRICITRMMVALLIATIACFVFRNELMDIIRQPIKEVWMKSQEEALEKLKVPIAVETWELAKRASRDSRALTPEQRAVYFSKIGGGDENFLFHAESVHYFRAALGIADKKLRKEFLDELPGIEDRMREHIFTLLDGNPEAEVDAQGKLVLMQALKPTEGFMLSIKLAFFAGIVISFPFLLYFLLQFVLPGLHKKEQRALFPAMAVGFGLFLSGVFFAYLIVLPRVLEFFRDYSEEMAIVNEWRIGYYISFATQFTLIFGLAFELPVVVMTLVKIGILEFDMMKRTRSYAILAIFAIAAIITPTPDAFTLILLALPMVLLYEICIWLAWLSDRKTKKREAEEEKERMARLLAAPAPGTFAADREDEDGQDDHDHDYDHDHDHELDHDGDPYDGGDLHAPDGLEGEAPDDRVFYEPGGAGGAHDYDFDADHDGLDTHEESDPGREEPGEDEDLSGPGDGEDRDPRP